jgi:hypothetical protein
MKGNRKQAEEGMPSEGKDIEATNRLLPPSTDIIQ